METNMVASFYVSITAISVIFLVLTILIYTIKALVYFLPYQEPPSSPSSSLHASPEPSGQEEEHIAAITTAMATYLNQSPENFSIVNIKSL